MRIWPALAATAVFTFLPAQAQDQPTELGTLTCTAVEGEVNRFATEAVILSCLFRTIEGSYSETYAGTLRRFGGAEPINGPLVLMWRVSVRNVKLSPGLLEQHYAVAAPADDPQSRELQGQNNAAISLRPFARTEETTEQSVTVLDLDLERTGA